MSRHSTQQPADVDASKASCQLPLDNQDNHTRTRNTHTAASLLSRPLPLGCLPQYQAWPPWAWELSSKMPHPRASRDPPPPNGPLTSPAREQSTKLSWWNYADCDAGPASLPRNCIVIRLWLGHVTSFHRQNEVPVSSLGLSCRALHIATCTFAPA